MTKATRSPTLQLAFVVMVAILAVRALAPALSPVKTQPRTAQLPSPAADSESAHQVHTQLLSAETKRYPHIIDTRLPGVYTKKYMLPPPPPYVSFNPTESTRGLQDIANGVRDWRPPIPGSTPNTSTVEKADKAEKYTYSKYIYTAAGYSPAQPICSGRGVTAWQYQPK
jgi:hypothetical protein